MISRLVSKLKKDASILEVGCSGGALLRALSQKGYRNLSGIDISETAIELCRKRGVGNAFVMDGSRLKFSNDEFDAVIVSDVLEHIEDEASALAEWARVLKARGKIIVFVPAFSFLWSDHDEVNHHYRRYTSWALARLLEDNGFDVAKSSYWDIALFLPAALVRVFRNFFFKSKSRRDQFYRISPLANRLLANLLRLENSLIMRVSLPFGVSVFCVGDKRAPS
jgi:SAM-dependent methyltransferase